MAEYKVEVTTGNRYYSGTFDSIYVTLIGSDGESDPILLNIAGILTGSVGGTSWLTSLLKENKSIH